MPSGNKMDEMAAECQLQYERRRDLELLKLDQGESMYKTPDLNVVVLGKLSTQVVNLTKERDDLRLIIRRLIAEMPDSVMQADDPYQAMSVWISEQRGREEAAAKDYRTMMRRVAEAEIALEGARDACTCGGVQHEIDGASKLFDRLEGTITGTIDLEEGIITPLTELEKTRDAIRQRMIVANMRQAAGQGVPLTATGVRIMQEQERARNHGKMAAFEKFFEEIAKAANGD